MGFAKFARQLPARLAAGAFILDAGLGKWGADEQGAAGPHGMAAGTFPFLSKIPARDFSRLLSATEITVGTALLLPAVPAGVAGVALTAFSGGLVATYLKTEGFTRDGIRPTPAGVPFAKDIWLLGIGLGLIIDELTERACARPARTTK